MDLIVNIAAVPFLVLVFIQDLKYRAIHAVLPLIILLIGLGIFFYYKYSLEIILYNLLFLAVTFLGLYMYLFFKFKKFINPFQKTIGLGDILFFISVIPFFTTHNYILFFITGLIFSLIAFMGLKLFTKTNLVPLAGFLALYMIGLKILSLSVGVDFFFNTIL